MRSPLTLESLRVIEAIERRGSFSAAAIELNKVTSSVSYSIQKLELDLGVCLFEKQGRRAVLTPAGRFLVEQGRQLLDAADELARAAQQVATGWEPRLRIAIDAILPVTTLMRHIAELYALRPEIDISVSTEVLGGTWEALDEDRVDLIVGGIGVAPAREGITRVPWRSVEHVFVASPHHPICAAPTPLSANEIRKHRAVVIRDTSRNSPALSRGILDDQRTLYVDSTADKVQAHRLGLGVGFVPAHCAADAIASGELVQLDTEVAKEPDPFTLAWRTSNRGRALKWLVDRLRDEPAA